MFLYVAFVASLMGANAAGLEGASRMHHPALNVKKIAQRGNKMHAAEPAHGRNLRDQVKPHDTMMQYFRDSACTVLMHEVVRHGNSCVRDVSEDDGAVTNIKVGCKVDAAGNINWDLANYGHDGDCAASPVFQINVPIVENMAYKPGDCIDMGEAGFAKFECSGKDPFRDAFGYHVLHFEEHQEKECHANSIKTNRPMVHELVAPGRCYSFDVGESIMPVSCGGLGSVLYKIDTTGEHCANLGDEVNEVNLESGCIAEEDDGGKKIMKEFCVDETTGAQQ